MNEIIHNIITKEVLNMNYNEIVLEYINKYNLDDPIFIEDVKKYIKDIYSQKEKKFLKI